MKTTLLALVLLIAAIPISAQENSYDDLMQQGIELHDAGEYQAAIDKYNEAMKLQPKSKFALYEIALSYMGMKDHSKSIVYGLKALGIKDDNTSLDVMIYNLLGSNYDDMGQHEKALKIYDEGLAKMDSYLLYFNKGLTYQRMENWDAALECYKSALALKPNHPTTHYCIAQIYNRRNDIVSAFFYYVYFMMYEPNTNRTQMAFENLFAMGEGNTIILPDNDQQELHLVLSMSLKSIALGDKEESQTALTPYRKLQKMIQLVYEMKEHFDFGKLDDSFCASHYAPLLLATCEAGYMEPFCRYLTFSFDEESQTWLNEHEDEFDVFVDWINAYGKDPEKVE